MNILVSEDKKNKPLWAIDRTKKVQSKKWTLGDVLFFIAFFSFCLKFTLDYSDLILRRPEMLNTLLVALSISCSMIKIFMQKYTPRRFVFTMIVCAVIGYSSVISINNNFLMGFLLVVAMQNIKLDSIVKAGFWFKLISIVVHVFIYIYVFNTNPEIIRFAFRAGVGEGRHIFFMGHANTFGAFLFWTCLEYIYLKYDRLHVVHLIAIWIICIIFFAFTASFTGMIVLGIITILIIMDKVSKGFFDNFFKFSAKYLYLIFSVIITILVAVYTHLDDRLKDMWHMLDSTLTNRLWFGAHAFDTVGHTVMGRPDIAPQVVFWQGRWFDTMTVFDNHYVGNLVSYGIINLILISLAFILLCGKMENKERLVIIAFSLFAIMQNDVANLAICFALFIVGKYLYLCKPQKDVALLKSGLPTPH